MEDQRCDECRLICRQTPVGRFVILCHEGKILCMDCNRVRLDYCELLHKYGSALNFVQMRSLVGRRIFRT